MVSASISRGFKDFLWCIVNKKRPEPNVWNVGFGRMLSLRSDNLWGGVRFAVLEIYTQVHEQSDWPEEYMQEHVDLSGPAWLESLIDKKIEDGSFIHGGNTTFMKPHSAPIPIELMAY
ncbi:MAG: hypothetical protein V4686_00385 [Patescibacteria group bacterium]